MNADARDESQSTTTEVSSASAPDAASGHRPFGASLIVLAGLSLAALLASGMLWQKLATIQELLARQSADTSALSVEARAMAKARTARFESADALIDDLEKARQQ